MIILDFGSGNTCKNDLDYAMRMIDELAKVDTKKQSIIKWQLFVVAGDNLPLKRTIFDKAFGYATSKGFQTTASVFDLDSFYFLSRYPVPFIKIANNCDIQLPTTIKILKSGKDLCCISNYPATVDEYEKAFKPAALKKGISDHTTDWTLYRKYSPAVYEVHYKLDDSTGLDAGPFARTPEQLREIFGEVPMSKRVE